MAALTVLATIPGDGPCAVPGRELDTTSTAPRAVTPRSPGAPATSLWDLQKDRMEEWDEYTLLGYGPLPPPPGPLPLPCPWDLTLKSWSWSTWRQWPPIQACAGPQGVPSAQGECLVWHMEWPLRWPEHQRAAQGGGSCGQWRESGPKVSWHWRSAS